MMVSTLWLATATILACNGNLLTAALPLLLWIPHRRWERNQHPE